MPEKVTTFLSQAVAHSFIPSAGISEFCQQSLHVGDRGHFFLGGNILVMKTLSTHHQFKDFYRPRYCMYLDPQGRSCSSHCYEVATVTLTDEL